MKFVATVDFTTETILSTITYTANSEQYVLSFNQYIDTWNTIRDIKHSWYSR